MITSSLTFAMHILVSSYKVLTPVAQLLEYMLPYRNIATKAIMGKINFNSKHLKKGDPLPPYNGKLRVYNMRYCPFAQRTILALNAKQIDYEIINIDLMEKPEWLPRKSPLGKVPSIEIKEDVCIYESLITVEYLDEAYPERPLLPKDPAKKAFDRILVETTVGGIHTLFFKAIRAPDTITEEIVNNYHKSLSIIEEQLKSRGTKFLNGSEPGYVDYMIWPWFEKIDALKTVDEKLKIDPMKYKKLVHPSASAADKHPNDSTSNPTITVENEKSSDTVTPPENVNKVEYISNMFQDPAVSEYLVPPSILIKYLEGYKTGYPNYELLNEK